MVGMDMVEVSPPYDHADITAILANRVVLETLSGIARATGRARRDALGSCAAPAQRTARAHPGGRDPRPPPPDAPLSPLRPGRELMTSDPEIEAVTAEVPLSNDAAYGPGDSPQRRPLRGIAEIRHFFRTNTTPIFFVGATPFNLLGSRPVGAQLRLHHLLRRLGGRPSAGVHPAGQALHRIRQRRGDQQLPVAAPRGAGAHAARRGAARRWRWSSSTRRPRRSAPNWVTT